MLLRQDVVDAVVLIEGAVEDAGRGLLDPRVHHGRHGVVQIARHLLHGLRVVRQLLRAAPHLAGLVRVTLLRRHLLLLDEVAAGLRARDLLRLLAHLLLAAGDVTVADLRLRRRGILLIAQLDLERGLLLLEHLLLI